MTFLRQNGYPVEHTELFNATALAHRCGDGRFIEMSSLLHHLEQGRPAGCVARTRLRLFGKHAWAGRRRSLSRPSPALGSAEPHRSREEWRQHPQGIALGAIPAVTIERLVSPSPFLPRS